MNFKSPYELSQYLHIDIQEFEEMADPYVTLRNKSPKGCTSPPTAIWYHPLKKDWNPWRIESPRPKLDSCTGRLLWLVVSKAIERSRRTTGFILLLFASLKRLSCRSTNAVLVPWDDLNANWNGSIVSVSSKNSCSWSTHTHTPQPTCSGMECWRWFYSC